MPIEVEELAPSALSGQGNCGISHTLSIFGQFIYIFGGNLPEEKFYSFNLEYIRIEGCHESNFPGQEIGSPGVGYMTFLPYGDPTITDLGNGRKKASYIIHYDVNLDDYCGTCYNPGNIAIASLTQTANSVNASEVGEALDGFTKLVRILGGLEPGKDGRRGGRISVPEGRRRLGDVWKLFDLDGQLSTPVPGNPCNFRSHCDLTP